LEEIFQTLRDEIDHPLPPTAVVWKEEYSPNSHESKDTHQEMHKRCACAWQDIAPSSIRRRTRGAYIGNLRSLLMTFTISLAFLL
jgi:hypothetical protein